VKNLRSWLAAAVALLALVETANALWAPKRVARPDDWQAAAAEVRAGFRSGDLIVFAPAWSDPVGRSVLGDLMPLEMVGRSDDARYGRIWEVSTRGAHAPEAKDLKAVQTHDHGRVQVALYEKPAATVAYDFTQHLGDARVTLEPGDQPARGIEARTLEVDYRPRRGILAKLEQGRTTRFEWSEVPEARTLVGYLGLHDYYARKNADGPIRLTLFIDGKNVQTVEARNADGWKRFSVDMPAGKHAVRVELSAPDAAWRNAGFHLEARS
jgi:hypothetical protein